jgi:hypothetical protein
MAIYKRGDIEKGTGCKNIPCQAKQVKKNPCKFKGG